MSVHGMMEGKRQYSNGGAKVEKRFFTIHIGYDKNYFIFNYDTYHIFRTEFV